MDPGFLHCRQILDHQATREAQELLLKQAIFQICNAGDLASIPGSGPGEGKGNPVQYPCLENPMDRGAWSATVHGFTKSWTQLSN